MKACLLALFLWLAPAHVVTWRCDPPTVGANVGPLVLVGSRYTETNGSYPLVPCVYQATHFQVAGHWTQLAVSP